MRINQLKIKYQEPIVLSSYPRKTYQIPYIVKNNILDFTSFIKGFSLRVKESFKKGKGYRIYRGRRLRCIMQAYNDKIPAQRGPIKTYTIWARSNSTAQNED
jgi:hypothetical protein